MIKIFSEITISLLVENTVLDAGFFQSKPDSG